MPTRSYPLAQFNIGNLYDELGRLDDAQEHYRMALELNPQYADAHFNLALLCERQGDNLKAVHHWKNYLKLDHAAASGPRSPAASSIACARPRWCIRAPDLG
jgi:tetratricopeptide (TPR) repeat protein